MTGIGAQCSCGTAAPLGTAVYSPEQSTNCAGDSNESCGSPGYAIVYSNSPMGLHHPVPGDQQLVAHLQPSPLRPSSLTQQLSQMDRRSRDRSLLPPRLPMYLKFRSSQMDQRSRDHSLRPPPFQALWQQMAAVTRDFYP